MIKKKHKPGIYATFFGNACEYNPDEYGENLAYDLDMAEMIPVEFVDFNDFIRDLE